MKHLISVFLIFVLVSCEQPPLDLDTCKEVAEKHIVAAGNGDFDAAVSLYAPSFLVAEPAEQKIDKLKKLHRVKGVYKANEFLESVDVKEFGLPRQMMLVYRVQYEKLTVIDFLSLELSAAAFLP
jgi:hypothetical protein